MWPLRQIKDWFFPAGLEYRDSLRGLVEYLPPGNLDAFVAWVKLWIKYKSDVDADGKYDVTQEYNGADLTIKLKAGDCESIAAVFSEVIRAWKGWESEHVLFVFTRHPGEYEAHDVAFFRRPDGVTGWIDGAIRFGDIPCMMSFYDSVGWRISDLWAVNDMGDKIEP